MSAVSEIRHVAYAGGWKRFEPLWVLVIRAGRVSRLLPVLEAVLRGFGELGGREADGEPGRRARQTAGEALITKAGEPLGPVTRPAVD